MLQGRGTRAGIGMAAQWDGHWVRAADTRLTDVGPLQAEEDERDDLPTAPPHGRGPVRRRLSSAFQQAAAGAVTGISGGLMRASSGERLPAGCLGRLA
jgi:hypothetical protein